MSYQPTGKVFTYNGDRYILGIAEAGTGDKVAALFQQQAGSWVALLPVFKFGLTDADIMAHGTIAAYLQSLFPLAKERLVSQYIPAKPSVDDKVGCVAYDLALDVEFDADALEFEFNKTPPLSHAQ